MPWLDLLWKKNPVLLWLGDRGFISGTTAVALFARRRLAERETPEKQEAIINEGRPLDLLARFQNEAKKDPIFMNNIQVLSLTVSSVFAGADSTAIILRAIFYYLLKNPNTMANLMKEIDDFTPSEGGVVSWNEARKSPYLTAVINEALRIHPAVGLHLERVVPPTGLEVNGYHIPGGTIVGTSAWPLHAKEEIFGPRTNEFRPERWLDVDESERKRMEAAIFTFAFGSRSCIGKNISLLEMYKVVPTILRKFEVSYGY
jgi:cytochrome P450